jgi:hypothetical protein
MTRRNAASACGGPKETKRGGPLRLQLNRVFGGAEVDEAFDAVNFADGDLDGTAELETAFVAAADEGGVVIGGVIEITR